MTQHRENYLRAAASAAALLREPALVTAWDQPSVLPEFTIRGLSGHLAAQVFSVPMALAQQLPENEAPISLLDHYARARWLDAGLNDDINVRIRDAGEGAAAADGPQALAEHVEATLAELRAVLPTEPPERVVRFSPGPWSLRLDDFLTTRMLEIAVHSDDLAASTGTTAQVIPDEVFAPVLELLSRLAVRRHGQSAVLRAFSRAERAPATITAM